MTRQEILNTPEIVDFMIDKSVMVDSKMKLHKRLEELCKLAIKALEQQSESEIKPIGYRECSNAMLKMWMDNVLTNGEYYRIMNKLNAKWEKILESEGEV